MLEGLDLMRAPLEGHLTGKGDQWLENVGAMRPHVQILKTKTRFEFVFKFHFCVGILILPTKVGT